MKLNWMRSSCNNLRGRDMDNDQTSVGEANSGWQMNGMHNALYYHQRQKSNTWIRSYMKIKDIVKAAMQSKWGENSFAEATKNGR